MYVIRKKFSFSAAHHLYGLSPDHPCSRVHGHNYEVEVILRSNFLNDVCFLRDYRELDEFKKYLDEEIDHRDLNMIFYGIQTSAENLAKIFFDWCRSRWPETCAVLVSETPKTWAEYNDGL
jgi:6-pyruvoyltetrahydropterin/6-carboxytetrahydropterin synthase